MSVRPSTMSALHANFPEQALHKVRVEFLMIAGPLAATVYYFDHDAVGCTTLAKVAAGAVTAVASVATAALQFRACRNWVSMCLLETSCIQRVFFFYGMFHGQYISRLPCTASFRGPTRQRHVGTLLSCYLQCDVVCNFNDS